MVSAGQSSNISRNRRGSGVQSSENYSEEDFESLSASKSIAYSQSKVNSSLALPSNRVNKSGAKFRQNYQSPIKELDEENKIMDDSNTVSKQKHSSKKSSPGEPTDSVTASNFSNSRSRFSNKKGG
jgi:hypothetical protein